MSVQFPPGASAVQFPPGTSSAPPKVTLPPGAEPVAPSKPPSTPSILLPPNAAPVPPAEMQQVPPAEMEDMPPAQMQDVPRSPSLSPAAPEVDDVSESAFDELHPEQQPSPDRPSWGLWSTVASAATTVSTSAVVGDWVSWGGEKAAAAVSTAREVATATKEVAHAVAQDQRSRFRSDVARYGGIDEPSKEEQQSEPLTDIGISTNIRREEDAQLVPTHCHRASWSCVLELCAQVLDLLCNACRLHPDEANAHISAAVQHRTESLVVAMAGTNIVGFGSCCPSTGQLLLTAAETQLPHLQQQLILHKVLSELMQRCSPSIAHGFVDSSLPTNVEAMMRAGFVSQGCLAVLRKGPTVPVLPTPSFEQVTDVTKLAEHFEQLGAHGWGSKVDNLAEVCGEELRAFVVHQEQSKLVEGVGVWWPDGVLEVCGAVESVVRAALSAGLGQELKLAVAFGEQQELVEWLLSIDFEMVQVVQAMVHRDRQSELMSKNYLPHI